MGTPVLNADRANNGRSGYRGGPAARRKPGGRPIATGQGEGTPLAGAAGWVMLDVTTAPVGELSVT